MSHDLLDAWFSDATAALEREMPSRGAPDFVHVIERAHERDPQRVSVAMVRDAQKLAPIVELRRAGVEPRDEVFDGFLADVRGGVESAIAREMETARASSQEPALKAARSRWAPIGVPRRVAWASAGALAAVAAASVLALSLGAFSNDPLLPRPAAPLASAALDRHDARSFGGTLEERHRALRARATAAVGPQPPPLPRPAELPPPPLSPSVGVEVAPDGPRAWAELAQARWRAGDLEAAERLLGKVVRHAGASPLAEMAYADLFSLAHQRHGKAQRVRLWKSYLRRFPTGRFAEDALAGVCRAEDSSACWQRYEERYPRGVYHVEARSRLGRSERESE